MSVSRVHRRSADRVGRLLVQALETRRLLAAIAWDGGAGTNNWASPQNWDLDRPPAVGDDVTIGATAPASIRIPPASSSPFARVSIRSLESAVGIEVAAGGSFTVAVGATIAGKLTLAGDINGGGDFLLNGGLDWTSGAMLGTGTTILNGPAVTLTSNHVRTLNRTLDTYALLELANGSINTGTITGNPGDGSAIFVRDGELRLSSNDSSSNITGQRSVKVFADATLRNATPFGSVMLSAPVRIDGGTIASGNGQFAVQGEIHGGTIDAPISPEQPPSTYGSPGIVFSGSVTDDLIVPAGHSLRIHGVTVAGGATIRNAGVTALTGTLAGAGDLDTLAGGHFVWTSPMDDSMRGTGVTRIREGATAILGSSFSPLRLARTFEIGGTAAFFANSNPQIVFGIGGNTTERGVIDIRPTGSLTAPSFTPGSGSIRQEGNAAPGLIRVDGGTLAFFGTTNTVPFVTSIPIRLEASNNATLRAHRASLSFDVGGSFTDGVNVELDQYGLLQLGGGTFNATGGDVKVKTTITTPPGSPNYAGYLAVDSNVGINATNAVLDLAADADLIVDGRLLLGYGGGIRGAGDVRVRNGGLVTSESNGIPPARPTVTGTGAFDLAAGATGTLYDVVLGRTADVRGALDSFGALALTDGADVRVADGATLGLRGSVGRATDAPADLISSIEVAAGGTLDVRPPTGTLPHDVTVHVPLHNYGTVNISSDRSTLLLRAQDVDYLTGTYNVFGDLNVAIVENSGVRFREVRGTVNAYHNLKGFFSLSKITGTLNLQTTWALTLTDLDIQGTLVLGPRAGINAYDVTFGGTGTPTLRTTVGVYDGDVVAGRISAGGRIDLGGSNNTSRLEVVLADGVDPLPDTAVTVLSASRGVIGTFDQYGGVTTPSGNVVLLDQSNARSARLVVAADAGPGQPPSVVSAAYDAASGSIVVRFNDDVGASLTQDDLRLTNLDTATGLPVTPGTFAYDPATRRATLFVGNALANGNYRMTINAADVTDPDGQSLTANASAPFFILAGDINRDRAVNFDDLLLLAQHYGQSGKTFAAGNLNYDPAGHVDFDDLLILAASYGTTLIAPPAAATTATAAGTRKRATSDMLA